MKNYQKLYLDTDTETIFYTMEDFIADQHNDEELHAECLVVIDIEAVHELERELAAEKAKVEKCLEFIRELQKYECDNTYAPDCNGCRLDELSCRFLNDLNQEVDKK